MALAKDWENRPRYIIGCIDSYGAIHSHEYWENDIYRGGLMHLENEKQGQRFHWNVTRQEWCEVRRECGNLSDDELLTVLDWLQKNGHVDDEIVEHMTERWRSENK